MMSEPTILLAVILASVYAGVFHAIKGRTLIELPIFWAVSLIGFAIGMAVARFLHLNLFQIGELSVVEGSISSIACLFVARWLKV